jgi:hypothetical protein
VFVIVVVATGGFVMHRAYVKKKSWRIFVETRASFEEGVRSNLPNGSPKLRVQQYLDQHAFGYKDLPSKDLLSSDTWYNDTPTVITGYGRYIDAPLPICRIFFEFKFDLNQKMLGYRDQLACKDVWF